MRARSGSTKRRSAAEVRSSPQLPLATATAYEAYQPRDAKRLPSRGMAMAAGAIAVLLLIGVVIWYGTSLFRGSGEPELAIPENTIAAAPEATPAPVAAGQVTLTATDSVWLKIYDATGKTLLEKTMAQGERYDVPADANNPMINVGRPDQIQVTINGSAVAPLGTGRVAIQDVPISAAALQARGTTARTGRDRRVRAARRHGARHVVAAPRLPPGGVPDRAADAPADAERRRDAGEYPAADGRPDPRAVIAVARRRDPR